MTCILGYANGKTVWIGGDSSAQNDSWERITIQEKKVFQCGNILFAVCGLLLPLQVIRSAFIPPEHPQNMEDQDYLVKSMIPNLRKLIREYEVELKTEKGSTGFILGYRGRVYQMNSFYTIYAPRIQICQDGSGGDIGKGAMVALLNEGYTPEEAIMKGLEIAGESDLSVAPPYVILKLENHD